MAHIVKKLSLILLLLTASFVIVVVNGFSQEVESSTIVVPDDYPTIQEAIDNASDGDTVFVKSGTYYNQTISITKSISLIGENSSTTVIQGKEDVYFPYMSFAVFFEANDIKISGFKVISLSEVRGIFGSGNRTLIENNIVKSYDNLGIAVYGHQNIITNNTLSGVGELHCSGSNNTVNKNIVNDSSRITIDGSYTTVSDNYLTGSISLDGDFNMVKNNILSGGGIHLNTGSYNHVCENTVTDNWFMGIRLYRTSNNLIYDNLIANNTDYKYGKNGYGISLSGKSYRAENNTFYRNTLLNNSYNIRIDEPYYTNYWDNGVQGNYWGDYNGTDTDGDGIGDTPYVLNENNQDNFPVMDYSLIPEFSSYFIMPLLLIAALATVVCKQKLTKRHKN